MLAGGCEAWRLLARGRRASSASCAGINTTFGTPKSTKIDKIHKMHAPKFQGHVFFEVAEAPQAAATQTHRAWGALKSLKMTKYARYMLQNSRGAFFLRSPKRRRQLRHRRTGLGGHETGFKTNMNLIYLLYLMECFKFTFLTFSKNVDF